MLLCFLSRKACVLLTLLLAINGIALRAQSTQGPERTNVASRADRIAGIDPSSNIQYVRLILKGSLNVGGKVVADPPVPDPPPELIAQCSIRPNGKYFFEVFASFGGATDLAFYPPWKSTGPQDLFPPRTDKVSITMDFLGYTHVKPFRRQWEIPVQTPALYRYNSPGSNSPNLEEFSFFLRYLLALPTLRLTLDNRTAEFLTTQFLADIRNEPLCKAASL